MMRQKQPRASTPQACILTYKYQLLRGEFKKYGILRQAVHTGEDDMQATEDKRGKERVPPDKSWTLSGWKGGKLLCTHSRPRGRW